MELSAINDNEHCKKPLATQIEDAFHRRFVNFIPLFRPSIGLFYFTLAINTILSIVVHEHILIKRSIIMKSRITFSIMLGWFLMSMGIAQGIIQDLEIKLSQNPNDINTLVQLGKVYHDQGADGNKEAVEKGMTYLDKALELDPANGVALAYRGSLWTMRARDAWWPFTKMSRVDKGIDEMDKAVELAPTNIMVRIVRGINSVQLPSMFKRLSIAIKDFDYLLNCHEFSYFDIKLQSTICLWAGIAYKRDNQAMKAKELFQKSVSLAPESWMATKAREELKELI